MSQSPSPTTGSDATPNAVANPALTESDPALPTSSGPPGMSVWQATLLEMSIIGLCILALILVFQPFSLELFSIGAVLVVVGGLAFNLVPFCRAGQPFSAVVKVALIVCLILVIIAALAIGSAYLYGVYITAGQSG